MEEQRQRQEDEARRAKEASNTEGGIKAEPIKEEASEEALLERALAMSMEQDSEQTTTTSQAVDFANMTEEEQIAFAMQMSMQDARKCSPISYYKSFDVLLLYQLEFQVYITKSFFVL